MKIASLFAAACLSLAMAGCTEAGREAYHDADQSQGQAAEKMAHAIDTDAKATAKVLDQKTADARTKMAQDAMTLKVKTALATTSGLDMSHAEVRHDGTTLYLEGSVPTKSQRSRAAKIAGDLVDSPYHVENQLKIGS